MPKLIWGTLTILLYMACWLWYVGVSVCVAAQGIWVPVSCVPGMLLLEALPSVMLQHMVRWVPRFGPAALLELLSSVLSAEVLMLQPLATLGLVFGFKAPPSVAGSDHVLSGVLETAWCEMASAALVHDGHGSMWRVT